MDELPLLACVFVRRWCEKDVGGGSPPALDDELEVHTISTEVMETKEHALQRVEYKAIEGASRGRNTSPFSIHCYLSLR